MKTITWSIDKFASEIREDDMLISVLPTEADVIAEATARFEIYRISLKNSITAVIVDETETSISHYNK